MACEQSINAHDSLRDDDVHEETIGWGGGDSHVDHAIIAGHRGGASASESYTGDGICTNTSSSRFVGNRRSSKRTEAWQTMLHSDKENNRAAPNKLKADESHVESFAPGRQALSERGPDDNHSRDEGLVSWQQTMTNNEQRPKFGLLQRIQERRQEAENRQRRGQEQDKKVIAAGDHQKNAEEECSRSRTQEQRRQETEQKQPTNGEQEQRREAGTKGCMRFARHQSADTATRRGVIVRLHSLESAPQLNGLLGLCLYRGEADRWVVHLDSEEPGRFRNVRQHNLEFVCCGGAAQPRAIQRLDTEGLSESCDCLVEPTSDLSTGVKRKHSCQDLQLPLAEQFAELEREQHGYCDVQGEKPSKQSKMDDQSREISVRQGAEGLVEDILERPDEAILERLMLASIEDLAEVVSPEAMAYVVLARTCRTRIGGG